MPGVVGRWSRGFSRRLPTSVMRLLERFPLAQLPSRKKPALSVIVPVYNVEEYLAECLDSVLEQSLQSMEIVVVDDGSTDSSPRLIADYAARDRRIVVITQSNRGLGAARNAGIAAARAPYVTFLDADDTVPKAAYAQMVATLNRTGSDFAVGAVRRVRNGKRSVPAWTRNVHTVERLGITIDEFPEAMQDVIACNRMFRLGFWIDRIGPFEEGRAYEDHVPMVTAYLRARSFDLLTAFTYNWRIRENATSIGQQKHLIVNLRDRLAVKHQAFQIVSREGSPQVLSTWLGRVINTDLPVFVPAALAADDAYRAALQDAATDFWSRCGPEVWQHARADRKLTTALVVAGRWDEVDRLTEYVRLNGVLPETSVRDGRVLAKLPFGRELDLPLEVYELSVHQTALVAVLNSVRWDADRALRLQGWAYVRGVDLTDQIPQLEAWLERGDGAHILPLEVQQQYRPEATIFANDPNQRYDQAGFDVVIPAARLALGGRWQLRVRVRSAGVEREGSVHTLTRFGTYDRMPSSPSIAIADPTRIVPILDASDGFVLETRIDRFRAAVLQSHPDGTLTGTVTALQPPRSWPTEAMIVDSIGRVGTPLRVDGTGRFSFEVRPPTDGRTFSLQILTEDGKRHRVAWPCDATTGPEIRPDGAPAGWRRTPRGLVQVITTTPRCLVVDIHVDDLLLGLEVHVEDVSAEDLARAELTSAAATVRPRSVEPVGRDRWRIAFPLVAPAWPGSPELALAAGTYGVRVPHGLGWVSARAGDVLLSRLPISRLTALHRLTVTRAAGSTQLEARLDAPLRDNEVGKVAQRRLATRYQTTEFEPADQVLFQCYRGEFATDSQVAIHQELHRQQVPLELVWGVADWSVELPEGARGVLIGSWEWYETLGRARYLCNNIDFDRFFRRRPYQRFLQTFHGYPFKSMGISFWRTKGFTERLIAYECERRTRAWTSIVVPAPFCEDIYRREYRYDGEVLVTGYPRDDVLVNPPAGLRERIRQRLGIAPDSTVVLYAPTWRENDATGAWAAKMFDELDLDRLTEGLGSAYTLLLRGHNYNLRDPNATAHRRAGVLEVTRYPEVNDLILAADVALLDYSSMRFDWLLTGKPLLFFVPDLEDYLSKRTALFEFEPTAPGPLLRTTDEVITALSRLPELSREYAAARDICNLRFNALNDGGATGRVVAAFFDEVKGDGDAGNGQGFSAGR